MPEPRYRAVAGVLRERIEAGSPGPGMLLPSELAVAREFGVARGTARAALAVLEGEGLAVVVPGVGRRVAGPVRPVAVYQAVAAVIGERIAGRVYDPLFALPSEARLMAEFGISRNTARRAYAVLARAGIVEVRHGAGAFAVLS